MKMSIQQTHNGFGAATIMGVLATVLAAGGYGGYTVYKNYVGTGADFDGRVHVVARVHDGDTFAVAAEVRSKNGEKSVNKNETAVRVRLLGINAPEVAARGKHAACFADEATKHLEMLLAEGSVRTVKDVEAQDDFGRYLRHVFVTSDDPKEGSKNVSEAMLRDGYARAMLDHRNNMYDRVYAEAERDAEKNRRGMWAACTKEIEKERASVAHEKSALREQDNALHKAGCDIKGNISEKGFGRAYFMPGCANYGILKVDARKGEQYFCTEAEARKAGYKKSESCEHMFR